MLLTSFGVDPGISLLIASQSYGKTNAKKEKRHSERKKGDITDGLID